MTNVGNEHGQILMSVVIAGKCAGLDDMLSGLEKRYMDAGILPEVLYVTAADQTLLAGSFRSGGIFRSDWISGTSSEE